MTKEEFKLIKGSLYQAHNALERTLRNCPELENTYVELMDGHRLFPEEILSWMRSVRADFWKHGPKEVQERHIKDLLNQQPQG